MKRCMSLLLAFVMCSSLCVPAMAIKQETLSKPVSASEMIARDLGNLAVENELLERVDADLQLIDAHLGANDVSLRLREDDGSLVYVKTYEGDIANDIQVSQDPAGAVTFDITEGTCHDVLTIMPDGTLFLDGNEVVITMAEDEETQFPRTIRTIDHSETPFAGTMAYEFSIFIKTMEKASLDAKKPIKDLAVSTIVTLIGAGVGVLLGSTFAGGIAGILFSAVASNLKSFAELHAPDSAYFSYTIDKYEHATKSKPIDQYFRYFGKFYAKRNFQGNMETSVFYEHNYIN